MASDQTVMEFTEPGATLADFLSSPRGRMALFGASLPVEGKQEVGGGGSFRCTVEQVRVLSFTVDLILTCTIAPLKGAGGVGGHNAGRVCVAGADVLASAIKNCSFFKKLRRPCDNFQPSNHGSPISLPRPIAARVIRASPETPNVNMYTRAHGFRVVEYEA